MNFKLVEVFDNDRQLTKHYRKHVNDEGKSINDFGIEEDEFTTKQFPTKQDYNMSADKLARTPAEATVDPEYAQRYKLISRDANKIICYVSKRNRYNKYNPNTKEFTAYAIEGGRPINITYHIATKNRWERMVRSKSGEGFLRPIEDGEDVKGMS